MSRGSKAFWNILPVHTVFLIFNSLSQKKGREMTDICLLSWQVNAEIEGLLRNYKQGNVIIPSFFKKLKEGPAKFAGLSPPALCAGPRKHQKQKEIGKKRNLELGDPENRLKSRSHDVSFQNIFKRHLFSSRTNSSHHGLRRYTGSPTLTVPGFSRAKYCPKRGDFPYSSRSEGSHRR